MKALRSILRAFGSLWFAAVLLVLVLVGMACATVFEAARGAEQALEIFYRSWWFETMLALLAVNLTASVLLRYPFSKRLIGFVVTHAAILVILGGALLTKYLGTDGQVGFAEGETAEFMSLLDQATLTITNWRDDTEASIDLPSNLVRGFQAVDHPNAPILKLGDIRIGIERYLPDSESSRQVIEGTDRRLPAAIAVSLSPSGEDDATWVFANHPTQVSDMGVLFRPIGDQAQLARLLSEESPSEPDSVGVVKVTYADATFDIPVEECEDEVAALGDTGYSIRVLRYLPHAIVGANNRLENVSERPVNPAIEVEIAGTELSEKRICFARFPGFSHGEKAIEDLEVTFVANADSTPTVPLEVLRGPGGELYGRFSQAGAPVAIRPLTIGTPVETPWPNWKFAVLRHIEHAEVERSLESIEPARKERTPALLVRIEGADDSEEVWVRRHRPQQVTIDGTEYELTYLPKQASLEFALTLNRFRIGTYPGTNRPRSFESHVAFVNPASGREQSRVISMNNPTEYGGYTFYQSSYDQRSGRTFSFLSVSRDPGRPIVFAGYIAVMIGMLIVLATRIAERRRMVVREAAA